MLVPDLPPRDGRTLCRLLHEARHVLLDLGAPAVPAPVADHVHRLGGATYEGDLDGDVPGGVA